MRPPGSDHLHRLEYSYISRCQPMQREVTCVYRHIDSCHRDYDCVQTLDIVDKVEVTPRDDTKHMENILLECIKEQKSMMTIKQWM
jgi:hypothetical protein